VFRIVSIDWGSRFKSLADTIQNPVDTLGSIGAFFQAKAQQSFKAQGRPGGTWAPRAVPNIPGILHDFHDGSAKPKARRFQDRPAVKDSGLLQKSIRYQVTSRTTVEIGVHGPAQAYADIQQFGGETQTKPVTREFQEWLYRWLKSKAGTPWKSALGWLLNKKYTGDPLTWNVTARPFLTVIADDVTDLEDMIGVKIVAEAGVQ
jgi:phage gpG-like protein